MEENIPEQPEETVSLFDVTMSASVVYSLYQTCRWARLLVFISGGAILAALAMVLFNWDIYSRSFYSANSTSAYLIWGVLLLFGLTYISFLVLLFLFSTKVKKGLDEKDAAKIEQGVSSLKIYFIISALLGAYVTLSYSIALYTALTR